MVPTFLRAVGALLRAVLQGMVIRATQGCEIVQDLRKTAGVLTAKAKPDLHVHFDVTGRRAYYPPPSSHHAYVDGSVLRGQSGFAVYYGPANTLNALVSVAANTDINCAELMAIAWALFHHPANADLAIFSDSRFALQAIRLKLEGAQLATGDAARIVALVACLLQLRAAKTAFHKVRSHIGIEGNSTVDALAKHASGLNAVCVAIPRHLSLFTLLSCSFRFVRRQHARLLSSAAAEFPLIRLQAGA
jgi:ribonuclease HI